MQMLKPLFLRGVHCVQGVLEVLEVLMYFGQEVILGH